ncbi:hypothetical protein SAMN05445756_1334 [Kytococcus aerolatus]|uniref:Biotin synthase auxiliary protein n=1 Tax=Kytococcus aerolatus TaxID=592308 RepID=A0A212TI11_9MICO|nr:hypothetical protein SAMN05445756_1334 [Kytococcus aerolatus]
MTESDRGRPGPDANPGAVEQDAPQYCGRCGGESPGGHPTCKRFLALEPPRYCAHCRRRMVVQVTPGGWTARCSRHGEITS